MTRAITAENFGAWLIKCDPKTWDFVGFVEDGNASIDEWSVTDNYRSQMMKAHDRIMFWKSRDQPGLQRGIWGLGHVIDEARDVVIEDPGYWLDDVARRKVTYMVPVAIALFGQPVTDAALRAAGIDDLEVQRMPSGSNPSWITAEQLERLDALLGRWPALPELATELTVSDRGAGFGSAEHNKAVEDAAMAAVIASYKAGGWIVEDVCASKLGWDLTCTHPDGSTAKVEVKGTSGNRPIVFLTANEIRAAREEADWVLAVVTHALRETHKIEIFASREALAAAAPYVYRADLTRSADIGFEYSDG